MKTFFTVATERGTVATSAKVALFVGTILALINYGDRIFLRYDMHAMDWVKLAVTYCVPYCVATYGAAKYAVRHTKSKRGDRPANPT
jgi:hypothetical protein